MLQLFLIRSLALTCSVCFTFAAGFVCFSVPLLFYSEATASPLPSARQQLSYGDYYQNCSVLDCVTQCSQSVAHLYEQFSQV